VSASCSNLTHNRSLFRNDRIALSVNSCGKSFHIDNKAVFSSAMLVGFGVYSVPVSHPHMIIQLIEIWRLKYQQDYFLKSESQLNSLIHSFVRFYRAMHFSAKRGIATACRLSVCLSVTLVDCDHIGWNQSCTRVGSTRGSGRVGSAVSKYQKN